MRLFAAIRPPAHALDHLAHALDLVASGRTVTGGVGPVRWTAPENWHLTMAFHGEVPDGAVADLQGALAEVAARTAPFTLALRGSGIFAHRTVWVGASGEVEAAVALARAATSAGGAVTGWTDERERSRPHLTVGRVLPAARRRAPSRGRALERRREPVRDGSPDDLVRALAVYQGPSWRAIELRLVASAPGEGRSGGPRYTDLAVLPLTGSA